MREVQEDGKGAWSVKTHLGGCHRMGWAGNHSAARGEGGPNRAFFVPRPFRFGSSRASVLQSWHGLTAPSFMIEP